MYRKVIENSKNHVNQMKNVYQIDQNGQNEPKLTKSSWYPVSQSAPKSTQSTKINQII